LSALLLCRPSVSAELNYKYMKILPLRFAALIEACGLTPKPGETKQIRLKIRVCVVCRRPFRIKHGNEQGCANCKRIMNRERTRGCRANALR